MTKGILFDKDGTLLDYNAFWIPVAVNGVRLLCGDDSKAADAVLDAIGAYKGISGVLCGGTYAEITDAINKALADGGFGIGGFTVAEVERSYEDSIDAGVIIPVCDDLRGVLCRLRERGIVLAMVTSDNREMTATCLERLGISDCFDRVYTTDGENPSKPDPYYIEKFCGEFGFGRDEVVMVGDTGTDMKFARNGGIRSIGVAKDGESMKKLWAMSDVVARDVSVVEKLI